jgi:hypothetical protein
LTNKVDDLQVQSVGNITYGFYFKKDQDNGKETYSIFLRRATGTYQDVYVKDINSGDYKSLYSLTAPVEIVRSYRQIVGFKGLVSNNDVFLVYVEKVTSGNRDLYEIKVAPSRDFGNNFRKPCVPFGSDLYGEETDNTTSSDDTLIAENLESQPDQLTPSGGHRFASFKNFDAVLQGDDILVYYQNTLGEVRILRQMGKW